METLAELADGEREIHVSLADVTFCDLAGLRAIISLAGGSGSHASGRRLLLRRIPRHLRTVMQILGWDSTPGLIMDEPEEPDSRRPGQARAAVSG